MDNSLEPLVVYNYLIERHLCQFVTINAGFILTLNLTWWYCSVLQRLPSTQNFKTLMKIGKK